jgi:hypothetical protein
MSHQFLTQFSSLLFSSYSKNPDPQNGTGPSPYAFYRCRNGVPDKDLAFEQGIAVDIEGPP